MRDLFIVGAKLMGIYFLLTDFIGLMQYTMSAVVFSHQTNDSTIDILGITTLYLFGIPFVIHVTAGLMLVFRTNWLTGFVGIPDTPLPKINPKIILQIGIVLLGIYTILLGIPSVLRYCIQLMQLNAHGGYSPIVHLDWQTVLPNISRIVFGGLLVFTSHPFSKMIMRSLKTPSEGVQMKYFSTFAFCFVAFLSQLNVYAEEISRDKAIALVTKQIENLERVVFLYSLTDSGNPQIKKLILMGRDKMNLNPPHDNTLRVQEELYWFSNGRYSKEAPIHTLGFSDGKSSYHWTSENNASNTQSPPNYLHVQIPPSIYLFLEHWTLSYIPFILNDLENVPNFKEEQVKAELHGDELTITLDQVGGRINTVFIFDLNKGLVKKVSEEPLNSTFIVDEFQQTKDGIWVPKKGRMIKQNDPNKPDVTLEVLKVLVNDEIDPTLFKNFPWDDPKYNTKANLNVQNGQISRNKRLLFKNHPPSYFTSFFDLSLDEAYQMYLEID